MGHIIGEPLAIQTAANRSRRRNRAAELLEIVGLPVDWVDRFPHELSGGQQQRVGIARAIPLDPAFVVADEAVSALDVSVRSQIITMPQELQQRLRLTYLFIAHGLHTVQHIADRVAVMHSGRIVEIAPTDQLFGRPMHHYTRQLIASTPVLDPQRRRTARIAVPRAAPAQVAESGCAYAALCPAATARCLSERPTLTTAATEHSVACHHPADVAAPTASTTSPP